MFRYLFRDIAVPVSAGEAAALARAQELARCAGGEVLSSSLYHRALDARRKSDLRFVCAVELTLAAPLPDERLPDLHASPLREESFAPCPGKEKLPSRPVVVGFGPCGMFAALALAEYGYRPLVLERGGDIPDREAAVSRFFRERVLDEECNVAFGAGGAGTFSDGKCVTRIGDPLCRTVLSRLVEFGAPEDLLKLAKPHIGTDNLRRVVANLAARVTASGGEICYRTRVTDLLLRGGRVAALQTTAGEIPCGAAIFATGHSASDVAVMLARAGAKLSPKDFSVGLRIEHRQSDLDEALLGRDADISLVGHASYALSHREGERGVYTFCMCPGGQVVAAASEAGGVVVNGMSRYARDGENANSALAVSVLRRDYGSTPLGGIAYRMEIERAAFAAGGGDYFAPVQTVGDFLEGTSGTRPRAIVPSYMGGKVRPADLAEILPPGVTSLLRTGIRLFGRKIRGFDRPDAPLTGVETRTSSPLRVDRDRETLTSPLAENLYPGGEGAGYAGGIVSAAVDGLHLAKKIIERYAPPT